MIKAIAAAALMSLTMWQAAGAATLSSASGLKASAASEIVQVKGGVVRDMLVPVDGEALPAGVEVTAGGTVAEATDMAGAMVLACGLAPFGSAHSGVKKYL
ncbi:MAG: hypothetical protein WBX25_27775 [Rhodomicrobium sp.]